MTAGKVIVLPTCRVRGSTRSLRGSGRIEETHLRCGMKTQSAAVPVTNARRMVVAPMTATMSTFKFRRTSELLNHCRLKSNENYFFWHEVPEAKTITPPPFIDIASASGFAADIYPLVSPTGTFAWSTFQELSEARFWLHQRQFV